MAFSITLAQATERKTLIASFLASLGLRGRIHLWERVHWRSRSNTNAVRASVNITGVRKKKLARGETIELLVEVQYAQDDTFVAWNHGTVRLVDDFDDPIELDADWRARLQPHRKKARKAPPWHTGTQAAAAEALALAVDENGKRATVLLKKGNGSVAQVVCIASGRVLAKKSFAGNSLCDAARSVVAWRGRHAAARKAVWSFDAKGERSASLAGARHRVQVIRVGPEGRYLAAGGGENYAPHDFAVRVWRDEERIHVLKGHRAIVVGLGFLSMTQLVSVDLDHVARVWDLPSGRCLGVERIPGPEHPPTAGNNHVGERAWVTGTRVLSHRGRELLLWKLGHASVDAHMRVDARRVGVSPAGHRAFAQMRGGEIRVYSGLRAGDLHEESRMDGAAASVPYLGSCALYQWTDSGLHAHAFTPEGALESDVYTPRATTSSAGGPELQLAVRGIAMVPRSLFNFLSDIPTLELLLKAGVSPNASHPEGSPHAGARVLEWAVGRGDYEAVRVLLEHGADPRIESKYGSAVVDGVKRPLALVETTHGRIRTLLERAIADAEA